jgi:hypothetical protein
MDTGSSDNSSSGEEAAVSSCSRDAADVAKASIENYYANMFKAIAEREKRYTDGITLCNVHFQT